jgi:protein-tyrosine kinase
MLMERLEAALAKAREARQTAMTAETEHPATAAVRPAAAKAPAVADWEALPEIAISPERAQRYRITALAVGKDAVPYDMLRSRTIRMMKEKSWTRLAVTSPDPGCGKTTVSLNLALSLARQKDLKVMLLDLDLRRPSLQKILGHTPEHSTWEILEGRMGLGEQAVRIGPNLAVSLNATPCRNPAELLQSRVALDVLADIQAQWKPDVILFDTSPMLASDDNVGFLGSVDCAILVAAAESTMMNKIDNCEKELAELTNVLGVVLNKCRYLDEAAGYAYGNY